jgi:hypothetical protein
MVVELAAGALHAAGLKLKVTVASTPRLPFGAPVKEKFPQGSVGLPQLVRVAPATINRNNTPVLGRSLLEIRLQLTWPILRRHRHEVKSWTSL